MIEKIRENRFSFWSYFITAVILVVLTISFVTSAKAKVYLICIFKSQDIQPYNDAINGFVDELRSAGYVENKDFMLLHMDMKADIEEGKRLASVITEQKPDLILAVGNEAATAVKDRIKDTPIVFSVVQDPVGSGLVQSLSGSGNNLTGSSVDISNQRQLEILKSISPDTRVIGVIYDPTKSKQKVDEVSKDAEKLGMQVTSEPVKSYKDVPEAVRSLVDRVDVIWLLPDSTVVTRQSLEYIFLRTIWSKKMVMGFNPYIVKSGALFALNFDAYDVGRQSGELAVKIIKGAKPYDMPVSTPRKTYVIVNLKIAKKLNMEIPESILGQAKEIVE